MRPGWGERAKGRLGRKRVAAAEGSLGRLCLVAGAARGRRKPLVVVCSNRLRYSYAYRRYSYDYRRYPCAYRRYSYAYRRYPYAYRRYSYASRRAAQRRSVRVCLVARLRP